MHTNKMVNKWYWSNDLIRQPKKTTSVKTHTHAELQAQKAPPARASRCSPSASRSPKGKCTSILFNGNIYCFWLTLNSSGFHAIDDIKNQYHWHRPMVHRHWSNTIDIGLNYINIHILCKRDLVLQNRTFVDLDAIFDLFDDDLYANLPFFYGNERPLLILMNVKTNDDDVLILFQ